MYPAHDIATFLRVIDLGSFAAVAAESGLTPSAISRIVSRLEDRLGVKLLQRTTRRLVLTQEGETYAIRGREIVAAIEFAEAEVTAGRGQPRGHLRINTGTAFAKYYQLVPLLENCHDDDPQPLTALLPPGRQNVPRVRAFIEFLQGKLAKRRPVKGPRAR